MQASTHGHPPPLAGPPARADRTGRCPCPNGAFFHSEHFHFNSPTVFAAALRSLLAGWSSLPQGQRCSGRGTCGSPLPSGLASPAPSWQFNGPVSMHPQSIRKAGCQFLSSLQNGPIHREDSLPRAELLAGDLRAEGRPRAACGPRAPQLRHLGRCWGPNCLRSVLGGRQLGSAAPSFLSSL